MSHIPATDIQRAKAILRRSMTNKEIEFDSDRIIQTSDLPLRPGTGLYWSRITVRLWAYTYLKGDEGNEDEPEFVTFAAADGRPSAHHIPSTPETVPAGALEVTTDEPSRGYVLDFPYLADRRRHAFDVTTMAFDSDQDTAWERLVDALGNDLTSVGTAFLPAAASALQTTGRLMDLLKREIHRALKDDPEQIGSDELVMDADALWERAPNDLSWVAYKFVLHARPGQEAWYMSLWRVDLYGDPSHGEGGVHEPPSSGEGTGPEGAELRHGRAPAAERPPVTGYSAARKAVKLDALGAAAIRGLRGEKAEALAEEYGLDPEDVKRAVSELPFLDREEFDRRALRALMTDATLLRERAAPRRTER